ncbi:MAG: hypothetical protein JZU70_10540, partial [Chlorobium sp.]|nr:hypothetical protein [Chlorobium sp.]
MAVYKAQPTLSGTATLYSGETLKVTVGTTDYITANGLAYNAATRVWTLPITTDLALGSYDVKVDSGSSTTTVLGALVISAVATKHATPTINTLATDDVTPVLTGTATLYADDILSVAVGNYLYTLGTDADLAYNVALQTWSLAIPEANALEADTWSVTVNVTNAAGSVVSTITTVNALQITAVPTRVNLLTTNSTTPTITGTATVLSGETLKVTLNGTTYTAGDTHLSYDAASRTWSLVPSSALTADVTYDVKVEVYDDVTLVSVSADPSVGELVVYSTLPTDTTVNTLMTSNSQPIISGTADVRAGESLKVTVNENTYIVGTDLTYNTGSGIWSLTIPAADKLAAGSYDVTAEVYNGTTLASTDTSARELVIFTSVPAVPTVNTITTNDTTPELSGTATVLAGETFTVKVGTTIYTLGTAGSPLSYDAATRIWTLTSNELSAGSYSVEVNVAGKTYSYTNAVTVYATPAAIAPVVNTLITYDTTPIITGSATVLKGETLTVQVNNITYTLGVDDALTYDATSLIWSLAIPAGKELTVSAGVPSIYEVVATVNNGAGADSTIGELRVCLDLPGSDLIIDSISTNDTTPTLTGIAKYGTLSSINYSFTLSVDGGTASAPTTVTTVNDTNKISSWTCDLSTLATGSHTITGKTYSSVDPAAVLSEVTQIINVYAVSAAVAPVVNTLVTNDSTPTLSGTATVMYGETFSVTVAGTTYTLGMDTGLTYTAASRIWTLTTDALAAGNYDVAVAVGSTTTTTTVAHALHIYEVATSSAPTVNQLTTSDTTPTLSGTATLYYNQSLKVTVDTTDYTISNGLAYDAVTGIWTLTLPSALTMGTHTVTATAGSASSVATNLVITAAVQPTVNTLVTRSLTPTISGTAVVMNGETLSVTVTNHAVPSETTTYTLANGVTYSSTTGAWSLSIPTANALVAGASYDVKVDVKEGADVVASTTTANAVVTYTVPVAAAPTVNTLTTMDDTPVISGTATVYSGQKLTVTVNGINYISTNGLTYNAATLSWSLQLPSLAVGTYAVKAVVTDAGNNKIGEVTNAQALQISVATTPALPTVNTLTTMNTAPTVTGTTSLFSGEKLTVTIDGGTPYDSTTSGSKLIWDFATRIWTLDLSGATPLATGQHTVVAEVRNASSDTVLRTDTTTNELTIFAATTATAATINTITTNDTTPTITGTATVMDGQTLTVKMNNVDYTVAANNLTYSAATRLWSLTTSALAAGSYTVTAQVTDGTLVTANDAVVIYTTPPAVAPTGAVATSSPTPTLTGSVSVSSTETLTVTLNGKVYTVDNVYLTYSGSTWTLKPEALAAGTYTATVRVAPVASALTMTGETVINSGSGLIDIDAGGTITLGKLRTTNTSDLVITSVGGALLDAGEGATDIIAREAKLVLTAKNGVGTGTYGALEIEVASLDISNTSSGAVAVEEVDGLTISNIAQGGTGTVTVDTLDGAITINGRGIRATTGSVLLYAGGDSSSFTLDGSIRTTGASGSVVAITTDSGNITLSKGIEVLGAGDITLLAPQGSIVNNPADVGWLLKNGSFSPEIDWAMNNGRFTVDQATGKIVVAKATASEEVSHLTNGTVLRVAEGPYIQTTGGDLTIKAKGTIGKAVNGFTYGPLSLVIDAVGLMASSADRSEVSIIATGSVNIKSDTSGAGSKGGATDVSNLSGGQTISSAVDASGDNISIFSDTISINAPIQSAGAVLDIAPVDRGRVIVVGHDTNQMDNTVATILTDASLANIQDGFQQVVIGSTSGYNIIQIGDRTTATTTNETITFNNNLVLENPSLGGEIWIFDNINLTNGSSLTVHGSGNTTHIVNSNVTTTGTQYYDDSVVIVGDVNINATGDIQVGSTSSHTLNGDGVLPKDNLVLTAGGNITVTGVVGGTDSLASFSIVNKGTDGLVGTADDLAGANNVTFDYAVTVAGNVTIYATGIVNFKNTLRLTSGNLTIKGASQIVFDQGVTVDGTGSIFLEADEVDFKTGTTSVVGHSSLTIRPTITGMGIELADPPSQSPDLLNLTLAEIQAIGTGFTEMIIGRQDATDGHAEHTAGTVRIGANPVDQQYTFYNKLTVYGGNIVVADYTSATTTLLTKGDVTLDAYNNIEFYNQVKLYDSNSSPKIYHDLRLYSENGNIWQKNDPDNYDNQSNEPIYAKNLITTSKTGTNLSWLDVDTITATNTGSGAISMNIIAAGGDVSVLKMEQTSSNSSDTETIILTTENGNITISSVNVIAFNTEVLVASGVTVAQTGNITIDANDTGTDKTLTVNKAISGTTGTIKLEADGVVTTTALVSNSSTGNIEVKSNKAAISQQANVTSVGGLITYNAGTSISMTSGTTTSAGAGAVTYTAATDIALSIINAAGSVMLTATAGAITDNLTGELVTDLNITGTTTVLVLSAKKGIGTFSDDIDTNVYSVTATNTDTVSSGIFIQERDDLIVTTDGMRASGTDGSIVLDLLDGSLTVSGAISSTGTVGNILLQTAELAEGTTSNITLSSTVSSTSGNISLNAADSITQNAAGDITTSASAQTIDLKAADAITMVDGAVSTTNNGNIRYEAGTGNITLGELLAGTAKVAIIATLGSILDADTTAVDITATDLLLTAGTAIGVLDNHLETTVVNLTAKAANSSIFIDETNGVIVKDVLVTVNRVGIAGTTTVTSPDSQEDLSTTGGNGNIVLKSTTGNIVVTDAADLNALGLSAHGTGNILLNAVAGSVDIQTGVTSGNGHISLLAGTTISQSLAASGISTGGGTVDLEAGTGISMVDGALTGTSGGNIRYKSTTGNITLGELNAGAGKAAIIATAGSILDLTIDSSTYDITASDLILTAGTAIGATDNHLEATVATLSAKTLNGGIFIDEATGIVVDTVTLTVNRVDSTGSAAATTPVDTQEDISATGGAVVLQTTNGTITVNPGTVATTGIFATGNILLLSGGSNDIMLNALVTSNAG